MSHGTVSRPLFAACGISLVAALSPAVAGAAVNSDYEAFVGCPQREDVTACQTVETSSGSIGLGSLDVPISSALTFAGGASNTDLGSFYVTDAANLIRPVSLPVSEAVGGAEGVSITPEVIGDGEFSETGLKLKLRVKLTGGGLPEGCAIGTDADPLTVNLTTGTTTPPEGVAPITGSSGSGGYDFLKNIVEGNGLTYVDNAYAVPAASGCGDAQGQINASAGLPAAPGASVFTGSDAKTRTAIDTSKVFG